MTTQENLPCLSLGQVKRIVILGATGSGKSTLATVLGKETGLIVVHTDKLFRTNNWSFRDPMECRKDLTKVLSQSSWIIEGSYRPEIECPILQGSDVDTFTERVRKADLVVLLDVPWWVCWYRQLKRKVTSYFFKRVDIPDDCPTTLNRGNLELAFHFRNQHMPALLETIKFALGQDIQQKILIANDGREVVKRLLNSTNS